MGYTMASDIGAMLSSLKNRPLSYKLNLAAGSLGLIVTVAIFIGAARNLELSGVAPSSSLPTPAQLRAETASLRAEMEKLAADLTSIQADLRNVAALPKETKIGIAQQQTQKALRELAERQARLEQIIVANPVKALEMSVLQRDLENVKATQQSSLSAVKVTVDRVSGLTKWALAAMALCIVLLAFSNTLRGKDN